MRVKSKSCIFILNIAERGIKLSANIKKLSTFIDNRMMNIDFQGYKYVNLSGAKENKDTVLYTLERFLARDFGSYYNDIDEIIGVNYKEVNGSSTLQYISGISVYSDTKLSQRGTLPSLHCIRYVGKNRVRSFIIDSEFSNEFIGCDMTRFSSVLSDSKWNRLVTLANSLVGYNFVTLDIKSRKLKFNIHQFNDWSEEGIKFVYLILSESMLTPDKYTRVTLLSDIDIISDEQVSKLLKTLGSISRNEMVVFSNNISNDTFGLSYKVLNLSV